MLSRSFPLLLLLPTQTLAGCCQLHSDSETQGVLYSKDICVSDSGGQPLSDAACQPLFEGFCVVPSGPSSGDTTPCPARLWNADKVCDVSLSPQSTASASGGSTLNTIGKCVSSGKCESWCNQWTCESSARDCGGCTHANSNGKAPCDTIAAGGQCESYCNDYTCSDKMCKGCAQCSTNSIANRCQAWCNVHTCTDAVNCPGCAICQSPSTWCEGWCNPFTSSNKFCAGCSSGR